MDLCKSRQPKNCSEILCLQLNASYYWPQRSCGQGNIFAPVCHSVHGGEGVSASVHAGIPPPRADTTPQEQAPPGEQTPPWEQTSPSEADTPPGSRHPPRSRHTPLGADTPREQTPPGSRHTPQSRHPAGSRHPLGVDTPQEQTPPQEGDSGIRSMSGRYASYWNAFLFAYHLMGSMFTGEIKYYLLFIDLRISAKTINIVGNVN